MNAEMIWKGKMLFECDNHGVKSFTDGTLESGGDASAASPKELVLNAMMGCTAIDVVAILKKMRLEIQTFKMNVEAEKTKEHPIHFKTALLTFDLTGELRPEKVLKAVDSSLTKYCGVNYMISRSCEISYQVILNGEKIKHGEVNFAVPSNLS
jgi:putative redox protein